MKEKEHGTINVTFEPDERKLDDLIAEAGKLWKVEVKVCKQIRRYIAAEFKKRDLKQYLHPEPEKVKPLLDGLKFSSVRFTCYDNAGYEFSFEFDDDDIEDCILEVRGSVGSPPDDIEVVSLL
ncbi:MAG: hypothetical protein AAF456_25265 [Planctomycetota bacterium]